jgi:hypothetical protein
MIVIELKNCGNRAGLFQTAEGAKQAAQKMLDEYHAMYAEMDAEEREGSEPLTVTTLSWETRRLGLYGVLTEAPDLGWDTTVAFYAEQNGYFTLHEIGVGA